MLPVDEALVVVEDIVLSTPLMATNAMSYLSYASAPTEEVQALTIDGSYDAIEVPLASGGAALPPGDGRLILFANGTADSAIAPFYGFQSGDAAKLASSQCYPRWLSLRGAE
jgi:hypothetical protein